MTMNAPITQAMMMAAGLGTRMKPLSNFLPKPLLPLMGRPIAEYALAQLRHSGVNRVVANVHHLPGVAREGWAKVMAQPEHTETELLLSDESALLLGSAGGIRRALSYFRGQPFFVLNADSLLECPLDQVAYAHLKAQQQWGVAITLVLGRQAPPGEAYSVAQVDPQTRLLRGFSDKAERAAFFTGVSVCHPSAFAHLSADRPSDFLKDVLRPAIERREVAAVWAEDLAGELRWFDAGSPKLLHALHLDWMRRLETGQIKPLFRQLVESRNRRVAPEQWISNTSLSLRHSEMNWVGSAYVDLSESVARRVRSQARGRSLGPECVWYGHTDAATTLETTNLQRALIWESERIAFAT